MLYQRVRQLQASGKGWDEILFVDFEDERLAEFQAEDFESLLEAHLELYGKKPIVFLDEVQNIPHWDKFVRRLADAKYRVYVTGSNAKMLSKEVATTLYKFATGHVGMNGHALDDYMRFQSKSLSGYFAPRASYINPSIIEERQLNVAQMDVFSRRSPPGCPG